MTMFQNAALKMRTLPESTDCGRNSLRTTDSEGRCTDGARPSTGSPNSDWRFNSSDIASWARFSGDYNPVHFFHESARLVGSPEIIVHGMLPLVHVKQAICNEFLQATIQPKWFRIACRFRLPVQRNQSHRLTLAPERTFALHAADGSGGAVLEGLFGLHEEPTIDTPSETIQIDSDHVRARLFQFSGSVSNINAYWIAIDSLVFSTLITNVISLPIVRQRRLTEGVSTGRELVERAIALQTTHKVIVSPRLLSHRNGDGNACDSIHIALGHPQVVRDTAAMLVGAQPADVFMGAIFVMRSEIGFLFKRRAIG